MPIFHFSHRPREDAGVDTSDLAMPAVVLLKMGGTLTAPESGRRCGRTSCSSMHAVACSSRHLNVGPFDSELLAAPRSRLLRLPQCARSTSALTRPRCSATSCHGVFSTRAHRVDNQSPQPELPCTLDLIFTAAPCFKCTCIREDAACLSAEV